MTGRQITVRGRVQGVGFRPYVWRLAKAAGLTGHVRNDGAGVQIMAWGTQGALEDFLRNMQQTPPPLAVIEQVIITRLNGAPPAGGSFATSGTSGRGP